MQLLSPEFYRRENVVQIAQELLGKQIITHFEGQTTAGTIVETEAYSGENDKACHAHLGRRTKRTEVMFHEGGKAYIYLCYGVHHLFNIVTNIAGRADAVLIRAIKPTMGINIMQKRRNFTQNKAKLTAGPGLLTQALGISTKHNASLLYEHDSPIQIIDSPNISPEMIVASPRIGVAYAQEDALLPWRFRIKNNQWCSKAEARYENMTSG